jgi:hypothetical protein
MKWTEHPTDSKSSVEYQLMYKLEDENGQSIRLFQVKNESATTGLHYLIKPWRLQPGNRPTDELCVDENGFVLNGVHFEKGTTKAKVTQHVPNVFSNFDVLQL